MVIFSDTPAHFFFFTFYRPIGRPRLELFSDKKRKCLLEVIFDCFLGPPCACSIQFFFILVGLLKILSNKKGKCHLEVILGHFLWPLCSIFFFCTSIDIGRPILMCLIIVPRKEEYHPAKFPKPKKSTPL